jgi:hypothetical protein
MCNSIIYIILGRKFLQGGIEPLMDIDTWTRSSTYEPWIVFSAQLNMKAFELPPSRWYGLVLL